MVTAKKIAYVELPAKDAGAVEAMKGFYGRVMGWEFQSFGPGYAAFSQSGVEGGINGEPEHRTKAPLVIVETDDLEGMAAEVEAAGGALTLPIFTFPGGRRFHFSDPAGNELAVMQVGED